MGQVDQCIYEQENKKLTEKVCLKCARVSTCLIRIKSEAERGSAEPAFRWTQGHIRLQEENKKIRSLRRKLKSVVRDKAGIEYLCLFNKDDFDTLPEMRPVEVFLDGSTDMKKYVKKFLTFVKELG